MGSSDESASACTTSPTMSICVPKSSVPFTFGEKVRHGLLGHIGHARFVELDRGVGELVGIGARMEPETADQLHRSVLRQAPTPRTFPDSRMTAVVAFSLLIAMLTCAGLEVTWANVFTTHPALPDSPWAVTIWSP